MPTKDKALCAFYAFVAVCGLVVTWYFNISFAFLPSSGGVMGFIRGTFANPAASSLTTD